MPKRILIEQFANAQRAGKRQIQAQSTAKPTVLPESARQSTAGRRFFPTNAEMLLLPAQ